ncbi:hypothetical protein SZN_07577 [Streptomyces zinciresistens K42]|uniref:Antibiotic biosynthesis monooxygenase n=1 Tax=Streptomyces zinciresistens K42 TaxID=700597 RepID=G2G7Q2_9ACTN|nr:hypothetical protein SZN_07577 [Streptomyces zinciresistens K42]
MSDHEEAPVGPVQAFEPPYYVAVFTTVRTPDQGGYGETSARMEELVKDVPGFLGMDHAQTRAGWASPSGTSGTRRRSPSGAATPSTARRASAGGPSGTGNTRCTSRRWSAAMGSHGARADGPGARESCAGERPDAPAVLTPVSVGNRTVGVPKRRSAEVPSGT